MAGKENLIAQYNGEADGIGYFTIYDPEDGDNLNTREGGGPGMSGAALAKDTLRYCLKHYKHVMVETFNANAQEQFDTLPASILNRFRSKSASKRKSPMAKRHRKTSRRRSTGKLTRKQKRALNRARFAKLRSKHRSHKKGHGKRRSSHRARKSGSRRGKRAVRRVRSSRGRKRTIRSYARRGGKIRRMTRGGMPSLASLRKANRALGINPRRGKRRRPSKCWGILRKTRRKAYGRR
jgi:hypothetical protein